MRKTLFTGFAALSLLICIGMLILWIRSYFVMEQLRFYGVSNWESMITSYTGQLDLDSSPYLTMPRSMLYWGHTPESRLHHPYFSYRLREGLLTIQSPHWFLALLASILPILWFMNFRRVHRYRPGLCPKCGYDLRASTERCPECGTAIKILKNEPPSRQENLDE